MAIVAGTCQGPKSVKLYLEAAHVNCFEVSHHLIAFNSVNLYSPVQWYRAVWSCMG